MTKFPDGFVWGCATSAYQIEGAHDKDGKGPSIWDAFCSIPGRIKNGDSGATGIDHCRRFKEDVQLMKSQGFKAYRFSISWPRVMPDGKGCVNEAGVKFYSDLIDELLANGIVPWATLYHWDLPLALEMEEDGWLNPSIVDHFKAYANLCFERFGDRVKHWITFNEPWVVTWLGYGLGVFAPGRKSSTEPYIAGHNILRSHGHAVDLYRSKFLQQQKGTIGITLNCDWRAPLTEKAEDKEAAQRAVLFFLGWFADPIYKGDYPAVMRDRLGDRLPPFTDLDRSLILNSSDFFGLNHYATMYVTDDVDSLSKGSEVKGNGISDDQGVSLSADPSWPLTAMEWPVVPWGFRDLLQWITDRYDTPPIYVTENGFACHDVMTNGEVDDTATRLRYYREYLTAAREAMRKGADLRGYFAWSVFDNFEWAHGYGSRFGLNWVDYTTLERRPKASARWFARMIKHNDPSVKEVDVVDGEDSNSAVHGS
eukprot:GHVN01006568.1.p1 GENE.GHVN01006568.1~~GHVN01006568.1.p1  ORF type:complete len:481 (+),score=31.85 GHVN01006568.1:64-1506(+)